MIFFVYTKSSYMRECIIPLAVVFCLKLVGLFVANKESNVDGLNRLNGLSTPVFPQLSELHSC
jgi:hypothetical protein